MTDRRPDVQLVAVVLLGQFNASIFQPAWFASEGLIKKREAEDATIELIRKGISAFSLEWCNILANQDRFQITTTQESAHELVRDLVVGAFSLLRHTPIKQMGINRDSHYRVESRERWHDFGHTLAPKEHWKGILDSPGLMGMTMEERPRRDGLSGYVRVTVGPSEKVPQGIYIAVNSHYEVGGSKEVLSSEGVIDILKSSWSDSLSRTNEITQSLIEKV